MSYFKFIGVLTFSVFFAAFGASGVFALSPGTDSCVECHTKPKYKKEDIGKLKECLSCHGMAGHPYKETAKPLLGDSFAEASDALPPAAAKGVTKKIDLKGMVFIPEGEFIMGTDDRLRDEKPLHVSYAGAFYIDRYEVTNADYKKFVLATGYPAPDNWKGNNYPPGKGNHPVIFVSWNDAMNYCRFNGKRLPREIEWEKAARGIDGRVYPWGDKWNLNNSNNPLRGHNGAMPVGSFEAGKNQHGLYDMSGNVWEWVDDDYLPHAGSDYVSPEFGNRYKILKGGSWWDCMFYGCGISAPTYNRSFFTADTKNDSFGFRCAADAE